MIAEYDPFHNGHALHLERAREITGADRLIVLMSGYVTQRGRFSLFDPSDRAEMAIGCGADIVYTVPPDISCRDAEKYALGMIRLLDAMGCVDCVSFGSEYPDRELLSDIAGALDSDEVQETIGNLIRSGLSYPRAVEKALSLKGTAFPGLISSPNLILAVSYIRALKRLNSDIAFYPVERRGDYHSADLSERAPSAAAVREAFLKNGPDSFRQCVPGPVFEKLSMIRSGKAFFKKEREDAILFSRLLDARPEDLKGIEGAGEGIENRILKEARFCLSRDELAQRACTTRFTKARLNRILTRFLLKMPRLSPPEDDFLLLRAFRSDASKLVKNISGKIPCFQDFVSLKGNAAAGHEIAAAGIWNLCAGRPSAHLYARGVIRKGMSDENKDA